MGCDSGSTSQEDDDEVGRTNRLFGVLFGNIDNSGEIDVDYLDEDAKEHMDALADKLGSSLKDIDLSSKAQEPFTASEKDYDQKAEDAVNYEDIEEEYEGPETHGFTEEDYLLPKKVFLSSEVSETDLLRTTTLYDDENYDEDEEEADICVDGECKPENPNISAGENFEDSALPSQENNEDIRVYSFEDDQMDMNLFDSDEGDEAAVEQCDQRSPGALPVLFVEDGEVILRFSEIFALNPPLKKNEKRDQLYSHTIEKYKPIDRFDTEEDDRAFFKSCSEGIPVVSRFHTSDDNVSVILDEVSARGITTHPYEGDENPSNGSIVRGHQLKEDTVTSFSEPTSSPTYSELYPVDLHAWEEGIIWGLPPRDITESAGSCGTDRSDYETGESNASIFHTRSSSLRVEPFGLKAATSRPEARSGRSYHPQILRLESLPETRDTKDTSEEHCRSGDPTGFGGIQLENREIVDGSWLNRVIWDVGEPTEAPRLVLDLGDEHMLFETGGGGDDEGKQFDHAGAMIVKAPSMTGEGEILEVLGQGSPNGGKFNISNDKYYSNKKTSQQLKSHSRKRQAHGVKVLHSIPALKLQTVKPKLSNKDIANFHRPRALWYPHDNEVVIKDQGKLLAHGNGKVILKSLGGKGIKLHIDAEDTISSVISRASKKLDFKPSEKVKLFYSGRMLVDGGALADQGVLVNSLLHLFRTKIHMWPRAQKSLSEGISLRPPGAFRRKSDLSVKDGHVFLMEYCEEWPLLLSNIGMGARLCTYYQKSAPSPQLQGESGCFGNLVALDPADKSPFLGEIRAGCVQSSLETNMFRAPIFPHQVPTTDYLLVRSAKGKLSIRRINRIHAVGQQEPHMEVMSPGTKGMQSFLINRLLVYMYREFRATEKRGSLACLRAYQLTTNFPHVTEYFLRKRMKHCADLQRLNGDLFWVMRQGFRIPLEEELRRMVTPENICAYESMLAGMYRLKRQGIMRLTNAIGLSSAMNQLPDEAISLAAASHVERELQITPWSLSANFVSCTNLDKENIERLEITGVGDPSGRGLGFSYVRVLPKTPVPAPITKKKVTISKGGSTVTGTDADLRRLSMEAAREVLLKLSVGEDQIEKLTRWHRIALIRKLSSEQAVSGVKVDATTMGKFARGQRMSFLQLQQQTREKCQEIWDRQMLSLSMIDGDEIENDSDAYSDLDSFAEDLENLLDAEEVEGDEDDVYFSEPKTDGVRGLKMRRNQSFALAEEEIEDEAAEAAELYKMLMDDDVADKKKKKVGGQNAGFEVVELVKKPAIPAEHTSGNSNLNGSYPSNVDLTHDMRSFIVGKKAYKKNEVDKVSLLHNKKQVSKDKKPTREGFVCGACGQHGHMRTNKNCPKYGEDMDPHVETMDPEKASWKLLDPSGQPPPKPKKGVQKAAAKLGVDGENPGSLPKSLPVKFKCGNLERPPEIQTSENQPSLSETCSGGRPGAKFSRIIISSRGRPEEVRVEPHRPSVVIKPPTEAERDPSFKKIVIRRPKETDSGGGGGGGAREQAKMKRMEEILCFVQQGRGAAGVEEAGWRAEERRRATEARAVEEREKMAEIRRYEEAIRREREEEERQKAKRKKAGRPEAVWGPLGDEHAVTTRSSRRFHQEPGLAMAATRHNSVEYTPHTSKRRRGGEVGLANILETIVDTLRDQDVSYLFLKPVTKKDAPDYLRVVRQPMDLSTIKEKVRRMEYKSREEFRHDVFLIVYNAHSYNDRRNPQIPPLADQLLEICEFLLEENRPALDVAEAGIDPLWA